MAVRIKKLVYKGWGLAYDSKLKKTIFVRGGLPGEEVEYQIVTQKKGCIFAKTTNILKPSPYRVEPKCPLFGVCGGCVWQNLDYKQQLAWKERIVDEIFEHLVGVKLGKQLLPIVPAKQIFRYRNKTEFDFGFEPGRKKVLGFHPAAAPQKILPTIECLLQRRVADEALASIQAILSETSLSIYDYRTGKGFLRNLRLRTNSKGQILVVLVGANEELSSQEAKRWVGALRKNLGKHLKGFWFLQEERAKNQPVRVKKTLLYGRGYLREMVGGIKWRIGPVSFFQANTEITRKILRCLRNWVEELIEPKEKLIDLYCGMGVLSLPLASVVREIWGIEIDQEAVWEGLRVVQAKGIGNYKFFQGDVGKLLVQVYQKGVRFGGAIIDPPRSGLSKKALGRILSLAPRVIFYLSCNPTTLARDVAALMRKGSYQLLWVRPFDMFPHTYHIENLAVLSKKKHC